MLEPSQHQLGLGGIAAPQNVRFAIGCTHLSFAPTHVCRWRRSLQPPTYHYNDFRGHWHGVLVDDGAGRVQHSRMHTVAKPVPVSRSDNCAYCCAVHVATHYHAIAGTVQLVAIADSDS